MGVFELKKLIIGIFFSLVVVLSLSARASQMHVETMALNGGHHVIEASGYFSTPCITNPQPQLEPVAGEEDTLELNIVGEQAEGENCIQMIGPRMAVAIDFKALKHELEKMRMDTNKVYTIVNKKADFSEEIDFTQGMLANQFSTIKYAGAIIEKDGKYFIQADNNNVVGIFSPFIELASVKGEQVEVFGHVTRLNLSGNQFLMSMNADSMLLLTGVSIATE